MECKYHLGRDTKRRCFECKQPMCAPCTVHVDRHYFCSTDCHAAWLSHPSPKRISKKGRARARKRIALPPLPAAQPEERQRAPMVLRQIVEPESGNRRWFMALGLLNALILVLVGGLLLRGEPAARPDGWAYLGDLSRVLRTAAERPVTPDIHAMPHETTAATVVVTGEAPGAVSVTLLLNGEETSALDRAGDHFESSAISLEPGLNVLQVAVVDEGETEPRYSLAHLVRRIEPAASSEQRPLKLEFSLPRGPDVTRGNRSRNAVAFTFDGGSSANAAAEILATLRDEGVTTTFFLTGEFIRDNGELVLEALADGHEIGNHTWNHPHLTTFDENRRHDVRPHVTKWWFQKQLADTESAFRDLTGRSLAPYWRAPYGEVNDALRAWAEELGYRHINWTRGAGELRTLDSLDWVEDQESSLYLTGAQLRRRFVNLSQSEAEEVRGAIFLMHLGTRRRSDQIHLQLAAILRAYKQKGFDVMPVSQLLQ